VLELLQHRLDNVNLKEWFGPAPDQQPDASVDVIGDAIVLPPPPANDVDDENSNDDNDANNVPDNVEEVSGGRTPVKKVVEDTTTSSSTTAVKTTPGNSKHSSSSGASRSKKRLRPALELLLKSQLQRCATELPEFVVVVVDCVCERGRTSFHFSRTTHC
jgi:hypothetical protein